MQKVAEEQQEEVVPDKDDEWNNSERGSSLSAGPAAPSSQFETVNLTANFQDCNSQTHVFCVTTFHLACHLIYVN